jgi:hypothetical protein
MASKQKVRKKRGPAPERLKIKGDWETAISKALRRERPMEGRATELAPKRK